MRAQLIVRGDATATAQRIADAEGLFRLGVALDITTLLCDAVIAALLFVLLRSVSGPVAVIAAALRLAMVALASTGVALSLVALRLVDNASTMPETPTLALAALETRAQVANGAMAFFGAHLIAVGWLVSRSGFLPRIAGALLMLAGAAYLIHSFGSLLAPDLLRPLFPVFAGTWALAEWSFALYLVVVGVRVHERCLRVPTSANSH